MNDDVVFRRVEWGQRSIDSSQVPVSLHGLIPFAELLGEHGHMNVEFLLDRLPQAEREDFENTLRRHRDALARWLDEACDSGPPYPDCHAVFSGLRMYADFLADTG